VADGRCVSFLGRTRLVLDYFDFVKSSQKKDAISLRHFSGRAQTGHVDLPPRPSLSRRYLRLQAGGREGRPAFRPYPAANGSGSFEHWVPRANPSRRSAPYPCPDGRRDCRCGRIAGRLKSILPALEGAANYLLGRKTPNGLISGSGFYTENPPRDGWDGVTQCYVVHAFRELARLFRAAGIPPGRTSVATCGPAHRRVCVLILAR